MTKYENVKERLDKSGLTRVAFAKQEGISLGTLYNWIKKADHNEEGSVFVPVDISGTTLKTIRIQTTSGVVIEIPI